MKCRLGFDYDPFEMFLLTVPVSISAFKPNKRSGLCSFIVAAPTEWNKLPQAIRTMGSISGFKNQLKTYLFRLAYPPP